MKNTIHTYIGRVAVMLALLTFLVVATAVASADTRGSRGDYSSSRYQSLEVRDTTPAPETNTQGEEGDGNGETGQPGEGGQSGSDGTNETSTNDDEETAEEIQEAFDEGGISDGGFAGLTSLFSSGDTSSILNTVLSRVRSQ